MYRVVSESGRTLYAGLWYAKASFEFLLLVNLGGHGTIFCNDMPLRTA
jgi:hypothetical protein